MRIWRGSLGLALLGISCASGRGVGVPCPEGRDWHFVCSKHEYVRVVVSSSSSGGMRTTTVETTTVRHGVDRTGRRIAPVVPSPNATQLLRERPALLDQPFRPLDRLP